MRETLTIDSVLGNLHKRFHPVINENRQSRPRINHKTASATITRVEYETLKTEFMELKFQAEMKSDSFEAIYLPPED